MTSPSIVWFRQDLRLTDNPALTAAAECGPIIPVFILDDETPGAWKIGGAGRWWLHHSLKSLSEELARLGAPLLLLRGQAADVLIKLAAQTKAREIYWNRCYEPWAIDRDKAIKAALKAQHIKVVSTNGTLLVEPWEIKTKAGGPYKVFTPFWRAARQALDSGQPLAAPKKLVGCDFALGNEPLESWNLLPSAPDWAGGLRDTWNPGEEGAQARLHKFIDQILLRYHEGRDYPGEEKTSRLSPYLHWGEISPRQVWHALDIANLDDANIEKFRSELGWREFSYHLLYHFREIPEQNLRPEFDILPWNQDQTMLKAWQEGRTGYPIIDAGMRELWATGWMHNRVRMITASFLVKHLLLPWQDGARWFWDTLVDADLANNSASWQWVAGCGADAAPFFRIFNPTLQGKKFDPEGHYVRRWLPELAELPPSKIQQPWLLDPAPEGYPSPIIDLSYGRQKALDAYDVVKKCSQRP